MRRLLREPLLHFLLLGGFLFGLHATLHPASRAPSDSRVIEVTAGQIEQLSRAFEGQWQRPPTPEEMEGLVRDFVREQVLYREALAMGLDRDDVVVRRRLVQKFQFLTEDLIAARAPTDDDLTSWLAQHRDRYAVPARASFSHVYFSTERRGPAAERDARRALEGLRATAGPAPDAEGDPFLHPARFDMLTGDEVGRLLGTDFAATLSRVPVGSWHGPVRSSYGWHLVMVEARSVPREPSLEEARDAVARDWTYEQRRTANEELHRRLLSRYRVVVLPGKPDAAEVHAAGPPSREAR